MKRLLIFLLAAVFLLPTAACLPPKPQAPHALVRTAAVQHERFADGETPAGKIDGINRVFTLKHAPHPAASLRLFRNGLLLRQGDSYTLRGIAVTMTRAPRKGDTFEAFYRY